MGQKVSSAYFAQNHELYFKFDVKDYDVLKDLSKIISIDNIKDNTVYAFANEKEYNSFLSYGIEYDVLTRPSLEVVPEMARSIEAAKEWDVYPTYDQYVDIMYQFAEDYPELCEVYSLGQTVQGRDLIVAKISDNVGTREAEPQFLYTSTMHGDETTGYVLMLRLIDYLLENYNTDAEVTNLVDNLEIWINPNHNPDGTYRSGNSTVSGATRSNGNNVDINRNFKDPQDGDHPDGNSYQPETIIMMDLAEAQNFVLSANFHGGTEVLNYPWDTWAQRHADDNWFQYVSREYVDTVHEYAPANYMNEYNDGITNGYDWYEVAGGRQDFYTYFHGGREITMELSDTKLLAASQLDAHWEYNYRSFLDYMKQALYGVGGIVTSNTGSSIKATVTISGHDVDNSFVFSDATTGLYKRLIKAGTYDITFSAPDHFDKTIYDVTVQDNQLTELDVELISMYGNPDDVAPTAVTDLAVQVNTSNSITLQWSAPSDTSAGGVIEYDFRYSTSPINNDSDFEGATQVTISGEPSEPGNNDVVTVDELTAGSEYYFAVKSRDIWNNWSELSNMLSASTLGAPVISVTPASVSHTVEGSSVFVDTVVISNVAGYASTLDFEAELGDAVLKDAVSVKLVAVNQQESERTAKGVETKSTGSAVKGFGGPDAFGYEWIDSNEPNGPDYVWEDISTTGTAATGWEPTGTYGADDEGYAGPFDLGFDFDFYGEEYTGVYVTSNGLVMFEAPSCNTFSNATIPTSACPNNFIAAIWDDMKAGNGTVYYENKGNKFVIQYTEWEKYSGSGSFTYQVVLFSNNKIVVYYNTMSAPTNSSTVGIENATGDDGLQIVKDGTYIEDELAIEFSAAPEWVISDPVSGTLTDGNSFNAVLTINSAELEQGNYTSNLVISSNDPANSVVYVPVSLTVGEAGTVSAVLYSNEGWNIVGVPVQQSDLSVNTLFNDALSDAFSFDESYIQTSTLDYCVGYWIKLPTAKMYLFEGEQLSGDITVHEGWNMVTAYNQNVSVSGVSTEPAGIITSSFFGFGDTYAVADELVPGKGYWVKASQDGVIKLNTTAKKENETVDFSSLATLRVLDANGKSSNVYFGDYSMEAVSEMPPLPPAGAFDVRFSGNRFVSSADYDNVQIQGAEYPMTVTAVKSDYRLNLTDGTSIVLKDGESITLDKFNGSGFSVSSVEIPEEFALEQNYPNPFNPSTTIRFGLPESADVNISIYNTLGEKVSQLVSGTMEAGYHTVQWNASNLASGVYFYSITAGNFNSVKKMMLLK